jgi:hypothetical protein
VATKVYLLLFELRCNFLTDKDVTLELMVPHARFVASRFPAFFGPSYLFRAGSRTMGSCILDVQLFYDFSGTELLCMAFLLLALVL